VKLAILGRLLLAWAAVLGLAVLTIVSNAPPAVLAP
jgi:hypothetical protein